MAALTLSRRTGGSGGTRGQQVPRGMVSSGAVHFQSALGQLSKAGEEPWRPWVSVKGIWEKEARWVKRDCRGQRGWCWAWLGPADPSRVQPHASWLGKLGCYVPGSLAYAFLPCSQTQEASVGRA